MELRRTQKRLEGLRVAATRLIQIHIFAAQTRCYRKRRRSLVGGSDEHRPHRGVGEDILVAAGISRQEAMRDSGAHTELKRFAIGVCDGVEVHPGRSEPR